MQNGSAEAEPFSLQQRVSGAVLGAQGQVVTFRGCRLVTFTVPFRDVSSAN
jgi:hypothetical protein